MTDPGPLKLVDPADVGMDPDRMARAAARMDEHVASGGTPAATLVVARHGQFVMAHSAGEARPGGPALNVHHIFPIASQTKPFTSAVVLALVERGLIGLNESVALHLPELADDHRDVLVAHLLTHTSGWHGDDIDAESAATLDQLIASIPAGTDPLTHILLAPGWNVARRCEPSQLMQYCSWGYDALGEIVRRVTGDTLDAAMHRYVFEPVEMASSTLIGRDDLEPRVVKRPPGIPLGPDHDDSPLDFNDDLLWLCDSGGMGGFASAPDLVRFGQMVLDRGKVGDRRVLSDASIEAITTNRIPGIPAEALGVELPEGSWSYGFSVMGHNRIPKFGSGIGHPATLRHGGLGGTAAWMDPTTGVSAAYLEMATEIDDEGISRSWIAPQIEAMVAASVLD
jgi:CubicO group peptidase (beta-lactamase class C family)